MTLTLPNLDDRTYTDLVDEAIALIPNYAPEWTNHNPSDPGITLVELFAYLTDMLLYRQNQVTEENLMAFLKLLNGSDWQPTHDLDEEINLAIVGVRTRYRTVTAEDFEILAKAHADVARAHCLPRRNLNASVGTRDQDAPAHVSVVIVPQETSRAPNAETLQPSAELLQLVAQDLDPRRLLTTQVHVVGPQYVTLGVRLRLVLKPDGVPAQVRSDAIQALENFLHPLTGGPEQQGWTFGRSVYVSEIYDLLDRLPNIDYVTQIENQDELTVNPDDSSDRLLRNPEQGLIAVTLNPGELVDAQINVDSFVLESPIQPFRLS